MQADLDGAKALFHADGDGLPAQDIDALTQVQRVSFLYVMWPDVGALVERLEMFETGAQHNHTLDLVTADSVQECEAILYVMRPKGSLAERLQMYELSTLHTAQSAP